jgi:DNA-binding transcriptional ArsR family regulator
MAKHRNIKTEGILAIGRALSDPNRLRALYALDGRELCVCQIIELLGLAPSTVSKHMSLLAQAGLVESHKDGRWVFYRLAGKEAPSEAKDALDWALKYLHRTSQAEEDEKKLNEILTADREELCRLQNKR